MLEPTTETEVLWFGTFLAYVTAYPVMDLVLRRHPRYARLDFGRQRYVVSNLLKATVLCVFTAMLLDMIIDVVWTMRWNGPLLHMLAPMYVNLDVVSLFMVPEMMRSTKIHHVLVGLFGVFVAQSVVLPGTYACVICTYAVFSMLSYYVNGFLALRLLIGPDSAYFSKTLARVCGFGYATVCAWHWVYQLYIAYKYKLWGVPVLLGGFVYDDIVLMAWLFNYNPAKPQPSES